MKILEFALSLVISAAVLQGFFLAYRMVRQRETKYRAQRVLIFLIAYLAFFLGLNEFYAFTHASDYPLFLHLAGPTLTLLGPTLSLYVSSFTNPGFKHRLRDILHIVPFLIYVGIVIYFYIDDQHFTDITSGSALGHVNYVLWAFVLVYLGIYSLTITHGVLEYKKKLKERFSNVREEDTNWMNAVLLYSLGLYLLYLLLYFMGAFHHLNQSIINKLFALAFAGIIYFIGMLASKKTGSLAVMAMQVTETDGPRARYNKSSLSMEDSRVLIEKLQSFMEEKRPYLNAELDINMFAEEIAVSPHHLSQAINEQTSKNFFDFVNSYRVEEFIRLIPNPENGPYTILDLAFEAGFNSKSTFNKFFKKQTRLTPSQYRKSLSPV